MGLRFGPTAMGFGPDCCVFGEGIGVGRLLFFSIARPLHPQTRKMALMAPKRVGRFLLLFFRLCAGTIHGGSRALNARRIFILSDCCAVAVDLVALLQAARPALLRMQPSFRLVSWLLTVAQPRSLS